jgi:hypothetical protein
LEAATDPNCTIAAEAGGHVTGQEVVLAAQGERTEELRVIDSLRPDSLHSFAAAFYAAASESAGNFL